MKIPLMTWNVRCDHVGCTAELHTETVYRDEVDDCAAVRQSGWQTGVRDLCPAHRREKTDTDP